MKIWYQSMTKVSAWPAYNTALRSVLASVADPHTQIEVHGIEKRGGVGDQYRYLEFIETQEVLDNVERATQQGFDAFLLATFVTQGCVKRVKSPTCRSLDLARRPVTLPASWGAIFRWSRAHPNTFLALWRTFSATATPPASTAHAPCK